MIKKLVIGNKDRGCNRGSGCKRTVDRLNKGVS